jgi:YcaO-like protein with predicted kinase domain
MSPSLGNEKRFRLGTHRLLAPEETLERALEVSRRLHITRVANITHLDTIGIPTVAVIRPNSRSLTVAQGKGATLVAAKVSGLMESIENYHAENISRPLLYASEAELVARGLDVLDTLGVPRVSGGSYDPWARFLWIEGHDAMSRSRRWLPFELVHADYTLPLPSHSGAFLMSDSGIASGNHPLEATSHAVCELVERDALTMWSLLSPELHAATRIDLSTVDDEAALWALERFAAAEVSVGVWETTSDVGIPAFFCRIVDRVENVFRPLGVMSGSGCHPNRGVALFRALSEAAQSRLTVISGSRDDLGLASYQAGLDGDAVAAERDVLARQGVRSFKAVPSFDSDTLADDLSWELQQLHGAGIHQVAVVDLSNPAFGVPVVRVVIPGLEGLSDAPGYTPGARATKVRR